MSENNTQNTQICPTCGTRIREDAARCLVCGKTFTEKKSGKSKDKKTSPQSEASQAIRGSRMPEITLSIPVVLLLLGFFLAVGAGLTFLGLSVTDGLAETTPTATETVTPTVTLTPTATVPLPTHTPQPTFTPFAYSVKEGDNCGIIAARFNISINSIILANNLDASCSLFINQALNIPQPTATPTPLATATVSSEQATIEACPTVLHVVQEGETMSEIAFYYGFDDPSAILEWNGKTVDTAFVGERLVIPECMRDYVLGKGTVTPTPAPPYPAPEPLLPRDGEGFSLEQETVSLQWSSVGELRENEIYEVTIIDITGGQNDQLVLYVKDTKIIVPTSFRPTDNLPHVFRWSVQPVAQVGVDEAGDPVYDVGGPRSDWWAFTWSGDAPPANTPEP